MVCHCGTVSAVDIKMRSVLGFCVLIRLLRKSVNTSWRFSERCWWRLKFSLAVTPYRLTFRRNMLSPSSRCTQYWISALPIAKYLPSFGRSVLLLSWGSVRCWISASISKLSRTFRHSYCLLVYDVWSPGLVIDFLILMYQLFYCVLSVRLNRTV
jgi:hypothetical protein